MKRKNISPADSIPQAQAESERLFYDLKQELFKRELSNSENFDKAILAYSSGGLGLSISFIKDVVPLSTADHLWSLYLSWLLFVLAIITVIVSFICSQCGIKKQLTLAERYYLEDDDKAFKEDNRWIACTEWLNIASGTAFILAVIITAGFVWLNTERMVTMKKCEELQNGLPIPSMQQKMPLERGAPVPAIQPKSSPANNTGSTGSKTKK